jgi:excinuclease ABC subunit C
MIDGLGDLIYIGKAKCLRTRLLSYFRRHSRDPKAGRILQPTRTIVWEKCPNEFAALHRELELIRRWRPRFNVQGQPDGRRRTYVCLGRRPAPYVFLSRRPPSGILASFGPVPAGWRASEAVRRLNDWFQLRDCSQAQELFFADQGELFPVLRTAGCLRYEIGTCLGPCVGACSRRSYTEHLRGVRAFLSGADLSPLAKLDHDMQAASARREFERAALFRDKLEVLRWLHEQLDWLRQAQRQESFVYPVRQQVGTDIWYLIHQGRAVASVPAPTDKESGEIAAAVVRRAFQAGGTPGEAPDEVDGVLLVAAWFKRYPHERERTLTPAAALQLTQRSGTESL